ncbi:hypothetical protein GL2_43100 [Microbulbifer sp. GL-2]|nr:hypothetical protein GL2_43100 [Microbulbifer sp. GL-2]
MTSSQYKESTETLIFDCGTTKNSEKLQKELKALAVFCDKRQHLLYLGFTAATPKMKLTSSYSTLTNQATLPC